MKILHNVIADHLILNLTHVEALYLKVLTPSALRTSR